MLTVKQYQKNLKYYYGYYTGAIDGKRGAKTTAAIKAFQRGHGLKVDGIYGAKTNAKLVAVVKSLQGKLGVTKDGVIGAKTIAAIKAVQKKYGLVQDGIAGAKTFAKLNGSSGSSGGTTSTAGYTKNFQRYEFKCTCKGKYCNGYPYEMDSRVIQILEKLRSYYGKPITITSGVRCKTRNAQVGGVSNSTHLYGKAVDIFIPGVCNTAAKRSAVVKKAYALGAKYSYANTSGMGTSVHINV